MGKPYSHTFLIDGFPLPTVHLASGSLPPGLGLGTDGVLAGTPTAAGSYSFRIIAYNGIGCNEASSSIAVKEAERHTVFLPLVVRSQ